MKILFVYSDTKGEWNSSIYRCILPAQAINRLGGEDIAEIMPMNEFVDGADCSPYDLLVLERNMIGPVITQMLHWQKLGKTVVVDFDDAYHLIDQTNPAFPTWGLNRKPGGGQAAVPYLLQLSYAVQKADGVTVPSVMLAEDWFALNPRVRIIPNRINPQEYAVVRERYQPMPGIVRIGWSGSMTHFTSWALSNAIPALAELMRMRPGVQLLIGNDERLAQALAKAGISQNRCSFSPWFSNRDQWFARMSTFDMTMIPMATPYDDRRSSLKAVEAIAAGLPFVASQCVPYRTLDKYGMLVKNTKTQWLEALTQMVDGVEEWRSASVAKERLEFSERESIDAKIHERLHIYKSFLGGKNVTYPPDGPTASSQDAEGSQDNLGAERGAG